MRYVVALSPRADRHLDEIVTWLAENTDHYVALTLLDDVDRLLDLLEEMPLLRPTHHVLPYRRSAVGRFGYTAWYQVDDTTSRSSGSRTHTWTCRRSKSG